MEHGRGVSIRSSYTPFLEDLAGNRIGAPFEISALEPVDTRPEGDFSAIPFSIR